MTDVKSLVILRCLYICLTNVYSIVISVVKTQRYELSCNLAYEIPRDDIWAGNELDKVTALSAHLILCVYQKTGLLKKSCIRFFSPFLMASLYIQS